MKVELYEMLSSARMSRRRMLQGATALGAMAAVPMTARMAQRAGQRPRRNPEDPGRGHGLAHGCRLQKVGEMCLGATKAGVAEGEFAGVELTFLGLNNQNLHNFLFRGFLKPWEAYTGAKINWIDLAQADYNSRLQQSNRDGHRRLRTSSRWARRSKATPRRRAFWTRCPIG